MWYLRSMNNMNTLYLPINLINNNVGEELTSTRLFYNTHLRLTPSLLNIRKEL